MAERVTFCSFCDRDIDCGDMRYLFASTKHPIGICDECLVDGAREALKITRGEAEYLSWPSAAVEPSQKGGGNV